MDKLINNIKEELSREASPSLGGGKGEATISREASPSLGGGKGEATISREASPSLGGGKGEASISREASPSLGGGWGRLIIFSAPSGSGKSTIVSWLMKEHPELHLAFSISCTSRAPRGTERNGVEYFFLTPEEFKAKISNNEFLEYEEVYTNKFYGTLKSQVESQCLQGDNVVFDVDVKGGCNIKQFYGQRALSIFIQPPSVDELRRRLVGRATDAPEVIEQRLQKASYELTFAPKFDHVVVNDDLEKAEEETYQLIRNFLMPHPTLRPHPALSKGEGA